MRFARRSSILIVLLMLAGCGGDDDATPGTDGGSPPVDARVQMDAPMLPSGTYESVAPIFDRACSFASCHGGAGDGAGGLNFEAAERAGQSYDEILVNQPACQYDAMDLVEPNDPENSWLYVKMAGPHDGPDIDFTPEDGWTFDPGTSCRGTSPGDFGQLMPQGVTMPTADAAIVRAWIENGAPGPTE
ncbi:hypothetical protein [Sandaracinus amylolyticus]|uniref:Cytochrome c domain-containing protein n=1 Tax=Sandaracinus amylolyticus TaxID=927083 RepID=A0A0F6W9C2_9BACT|nr:hypothetical protein [Sandaracinus amylolyticus]AKF10658.1 hypothetical protein DB32_007807 [Sandaracinus amylolyticus]